MQHCPAQTYNLPLQWYGLELKLGEIAELLGRRVLKKDECFSVAQKLHFTSESFEAALCYLHNLNILFYYPDILPSVVFCDPQVILDKITELVEHSYQLRDLPQQLATYGEFRKFRDRGIVTVKLLQEKCFSKHYSPGVFSPYELVTLFRGLLIFADLGDRTFFMPCLLPWLNERELSEHRVNTEGMCTGQESALAPLILKLPDGPRNGLFCSLISSLISKCDTSPVPTLLEVDINLISQAPTCLKRNCVQLAVRGYPSYITLIDSIDYLEVHVTSSPDYEDSLELARDVCDTLRLGLKEAVEKVGYGKLKVIKKSFFCPCSDKDPHLVIFGKKSWICPRNRIISGKLKENQIIWLKVPDGKILDLSHTIPSSEDKSTELDETMGDREVEGSKN